MSSSEAHWLGLYNQLRDVLGEKHAETFVNKLDELATRDELRETRDELRGDIAKLRSEVETGFQRVNDRLDALTLELAALGRQQSVVIGGSMVALTAIFTLILALMG